MNEHTKSEYKKVFFQSVLVGFLVGAVITIVFITVGEWV